MPIIPSSCYQGGGGRPPPAKKIASLPSPSRRAPEYEKTSWQCSGKIASESVLRSK